MQNVFDLEDTTTIPQDVSYVVSYPCLIDFFSTKKGLFSACDLVCGAHMVYGWMPTILDLYPSQEFSLDMGVALLHEARTSGSLNKEQLGKLAGLVNNSLVGASKLLHFISPENFAIWDSKIYSFIYEEKPHNHRVNNVQKYLDYLKLLQELSNDNRFPIFYSSIKRKLGYEVTPLRALEIVMFLRAPKI